MSVIDDPMDELLIEHVAKAICNADIQNCGTFAVWPEEGDDTRWAERGREEFREIARVAIRAIQGQQDAAEFWATDFPATDPALVEKGEATAELVVGYGLVGQPMTYERHPIVDFTPKYDHPYHETKRKSVRDEIAQVLNRYSQESGSNTPDFILAQYLVDALAAFDRATNARTEWLKP